jgi:circadian clock protein KaiC
MNRSTKTLSEDILEKEPTGIEGFDEITEGGLPKGRPTLVTGTAGSGKTLFAMEFLLRGAVQYNEPGVFIAFEETADDLRKNFRSLGFDLRDLVKKKKLAIDYIYIERSEIEQTGEYDLEGLFVRLAYAIDSIGAKRIVLDTIEVLFSGLDDTAILRAELRRLFKWLKDRGMTAVVTGEQGEGMLTRYGLEEYVADCVIQLQHRVTEKITTRLMRIVKYRGSRHGTNEYPFMVGETGLIVMPVTSTGLTHPALKDRTSTGLPELNAMLGGKGYFRGSSILISGSPGTGKTTFASYFAAGACARGEKVLYFAFEESRDQIVRNMVSIGVDLDPYIKRGLLRIEASRPTVFGLEMHLVRIHKMVSEFKPKVVIVDPMTNLLAIGSASEIQSMLSRLVDYLKTQQITALSTALVKYSADEDEQEVGVSSVMDTWIKLLDVRHEGKRSNGVLIIKSRGMGHERQVRPFEIDNRGVHIDTGTRKRQKVKEHSTSGSRENKR